MDEPMNHNTSRKNRLRMNLLPPSEDFPQVLNIQNAENEDKFVENEIPEAIFEMLRLGDAKLAENQMLN